MESHVHPLFDEANHVPALMARQEASGLDHTQVRKATGLRGGGWGAVRGGTLTNQS